MLTVARLAELNQWSDPEATGNEIKEYLASLEPNDRANLVSLSELKTAADLDQMAEDASLFNPDSELFVRVAATLRRCADEIKAAAEPILTTVTELIPEEAPAAKYELPVIGLTGGAAPEHAYATVAVMLQGGPLKLTKTAGWAALARRPSDNVYVDESLVKWLVDHKLIVPALTTAPGAEPIEWHLSAIGWRTAGILYTDKTADVELRVYELWGTPKDNPIAARYRSIIADYRARQSRKDVTPAWNRWSEFEVSLSAKATGGDSATVVVIFESGYHQQPDTFDFFGPVKDGYQQHTQPPGATAGKSVFDRAHELAASYVRAHIDSRPAPRAKVTKPEFKLVEDGEDVEELAAALGII